jgi:hypothetical protein
MPKCRTLLVGLPLCLVLLGCSQKFPTAPVSGTITYKGQPVSFGKVSFMDAQGRAGWGDIHDGQYSLRAPVGDCKVRIESRDLEPPPDSKKAKQARPGMYIGQSHIPEKYESFQQSGLTFNVENKDNKADFILKD